MMTLGKRLKEEREKRKWSQKFVAEKLGITNTVLSNYERDYRDPDTENLKKLAELYEVSTDYLLGRETTSKERPDVQGIWFYDMDDISEEEFQEIEEELNEYKEYLLAKKRKKK